MSELSSTIRDYIGSEPIALDEHTSEEGHRVLTAVVLQEPPVEISTLAGDAIHNARTGLDHLACAIVDLYGGDTEHARFPFKKTQVGFGKELSAGLPGVPLAIRQIVADARPWPGGDDKLWQLHQLDIIDKHRLLLTTGVQNRGLLVRGFLHVPGGEPFSWELPLRAKDPEFPLKGGEEVFRDMRPHEQRENTGPVRHEYAPTFDLVFDKTLPVAGEPVLALVQELVQHARTVGESIAAAVWRAGAPEARS